MLENKGYITRVSKGLYSFNIKDENLKPIPSPLAIKIIDILSESGINFFFSGLDVLSIFMEHLPETFPILLFVEKYTPEEVKHIISKNNIISVIAKDFRNQPVISGISGINDIILLKETTEFTYSQGGLASFEKAFVDIYYETTRKDYPISIQELTRIYFNMKRRLPLDTNRLIKIASRRNIQADMQFLVNSQHITDMAFEFASYTLK